MASFNALLCLTSAQNAVTAPLSPAATTVPSTDSAGAPLFDSETLQLTDAVLKNVSKTLQNESLAAIFGFSSTSSIAETATKRANNRNCKLLPGDWLWPSDLIWDIFNILLGDGLIKTVPSAAPCYKSWPEYNEAKCAAITASWTSSNFQ